MSRILVVDDDPMMRSVIAKAFEPCGYEVYYASDGLHALDALRCNPGFDLLITDISMPVMEGRALISTIVADKALPGIPIIVVSGVVGVNDIAGLLDLGTTKVVAKPINMESFRADVVSCLEMGPVLCES